MPTAILALAMALGLWFPARVDAAANTIYAPAPIATDDLGHWWLDGRWHSADGSPYLPDGLGHFWRAGVWLNADGSVWAPEPPAPATWEDHALAAGWPVDLLPALGRVISCESGFNPAAYNPGGPYVGLMQLSPMWFRYAGEAFEAWADPAVNLRVAWATYRYDLARGNAPWAQWECKP